MAIKIYADGADLMKMHELAADPHIAGFTTNPTLARKAAVGDYRSFCLSALAVATGKPVSLEVLADDFPEMLRQAHVLSELGSNAVVKIPVTNSRGESSAPTIRRLAADGVKLNVTAVFTLDQVEDVGRALREDGWRTFPIVSVFAGRIADAGWDPFLHVSECRERLRAVCPRAQMLWASPRQAYDLVIASNARCEIITMTPDLIAKTALQGKDLAEYSLETVQMFLRDSQEAGFEL